MLYYNILNWKLKSLTAVSSDHKFQDIIIAMSLNDSSKFLKLNLKT